VDRFHRLFGDAATPVRHLVERVQPTGHAERKEAQQTEEEAFATKEETGDRHVQRTVMTSLYEVCGCSEAEVADLRPHDTPPAPICSGSPQLYVLFLEGDEIYVGQTDTLHSRLVSHRRRFGSSLRRVLSVQVRDTAQARQMESMLQRKLQRAGVLLASNKDASHRHFGSRMTQADYQMCGILGDVKMHCGSMETEADRLRSTAQYLLGLADRLEGLSLSE